MVTMLASELRGRLGAMLHNGSSVLSGGSAAARTPTVIVAVRSSATTSSGELTCFPFRTTTSPLPLSFKCKAKAGADAAVAEFNEGSAAESYPPSVFPRDSPRVETGMRGIADVIGNARSLDYSLERLGENEQQTGSGRESSLDWKTDERITRSCEAGTSLRVAVLVSGGVDSSVALRLLCEAGHFCTAFYLKIWFQEDFENFWSSCPWEEDLSYAQAACDEAGVELKVVYLTDAYWGKVVSESISEIRAGRTPNPDMLCNSMIKFGEFLEHIKDENFDRAASGHYARVKRMADSNGDHVTQLLLSADEAKDQTYFLSQLSQSQLSRLSFPLGELTKVEVREVASAMGLSNNQRKDSQGICFLGKVKFSEFIARHLGEKEGCLLEAESGELLGRHKGFWFYTIGQRHGIRLSNGPWFVVAKDVEHNVIFVSRTYFTEKRRRSFRVRSFNWASGLHPSNLENLRCKVRHGPKFYNCTMIFNDSGLLETTGTTGNELLNDRCSTAVVNLAEDDQGLAPGQYAAFYQDDVCLGSGIIFEALGEEKALNVSVKALAAAEVCNNPEFLRDHNGTKNKAGRNPKKVRAAVTLPQDKSLGSNSSRVGRKHDIEDYRNSQITDLVTEKHTKLSDAGADLTFTGFRGITPIPPGVFNNTPGGVKEFPAVKGLGISGSLLNFGPNSINAIHSHPRANAVFFLLSGQIEAGLVDTSKRYLNSVLKAGDAFVIPRGQLHWQINRDPVNIAFALAAVSSETPGRVSIFANIFNSVPLVQSDVIEKSFEVDTATGKMLNKFKFP